MTTKSPAVAANPPSFDTERDRQKSIFGGHVAELPPEESATVRGLLMAQLRHGDFSQELCVQKADCQLAAKGGERSDRDQLPGPLEVGGAVPQTAPIPS